MTTSPSREAPIACTLAVGDFAERTRWIADLNRAGLREQHRDGLRRDLTAAPAALDEVREMARREQGRCGFLPFTLRRDADAVLLTIEAPEAVREGADTVFEPFLGGGGDEAACNCCEGAQR